MRKDIDDLKALDDKIKIIKNGKEFRPYDDFSHIKIELEIDDETAEEFPEIDEAGYLLSIKRIYGSVLIDDEDPSLTLMANIDTNNTSSWKISTSRVERISNIIFTHEVEINLDTKEIHVLFNACS